MPRVTVAARAHCPVAQKYLETVARQNASPGEDGGEMKLEDM